MELLKRVKKKFRTPTSDEILSELKNRGAEIGEHVVVYDPAHTVIDKTRPWLLKIGSYTKITGGVTILTHDYSLSVLRRVYGEWIGEGDVTEIGENCFLGMYSIVLMGAKIGNNVIVGAGSVVKGIIPDNCVIAGNPAKIICGLEEYYEKRKKLSIEECKKCIKRFYQINGRMPQPREISGFKFLFVPRNRETVKKYGLNFFCSGDEPDEVEEAFYSSTPFWKDYETMIDDIRHEMNQKETN